jgi:hypothetical protein
MMKNAFRAALLGAAVLSAGCFGGRRVYHVDGCDSRLQMREKREACRACVERPVPHVYLPDNPEGDRCAVR